MSVLFAYTSSLCMHESLSHKKSNLVYTEFDARILRIIMSDLAGDWDNGAPESSGSEYDVDSETEFAPKVVSMNFDREDCFNGEELDLFPANELPDILRPKFTKLSSRYHKFKEGKPVSDYIKEWIVHIYKNRKTNKYTAVMGGFKGKSLPKICKIYNLKVSTVENWVRTINEGRSFNDVTGRPVLLTHEQLQTLRDEVEIAQGNQNCMTYSSFRRRMREMVQSSVGTAKVSILTIKSYLKQMSCYVVIPQGTTKARIIASQDLANAVSQAAILSARCKNVKDQNMHSCDCTSFEMKSEGKGELVVHARDDDNFTKNTQLKTDIPTTIKASNQMNIFIKYMFCGASKGYVAPICLSLPIKKMGPQEFFKYRLNHLTTTTSPTSPPGYIILTEKRGGNLASWHWYFKDVLIPHLQSCRLACEGNETDIIFVSLDGEKLILDSIMDVVDPATGKKLSTVFRELNIDIVKSSASCSLITNPADTGEVFRGTKAGIRSLQARGFGDGGEYLPDAGLKEELDKMFVEFKRQFPRAVPSDYCAVKTKYSDGILKVHSVISLSVSARVSVSITLESALREHHKLKKQMVHSTWRDYSESNYEECR